jgi:signal transduction histidine kinase
LASFFLQIHFQNFIINIPVNKKSEIRPTHKTALFLLSILLCFSLQVNKIFAQNITAIGIPFPGFMEVDDSGEFSGFIIDLVKEIESSLGWEVEYIVRPLTIGELGSFLEDETPTLLLGLTKTDERAQQFIFSAEPLLTSWGQVFSRNDNQINSIFDLENKIIGVVKEDSTGQNLLDIISRFQLDHGVIEYDSFPLLAEGLNDGEVDYIVLSNYLGIQLSSEGIDLVSTPVVFSPETIHIAMAKNQDTSFLDSIDIILKGWKTDESSPYSTLLNQYFSTSRIDEEIPLLISIVVFSLLAIVLIAFSLNSLLQYRVNKQTEELKNREEELKNLNAQLEHRIDQRSEEIQHYHEHILLSEKSADLGQMIGGLAHELNTPLGVSLMALNTLKEKSQSLISGQGNERDRLIQRESLDLIETNLNRANHILTMLKDLSMDLRHDEKSDTEVLGLVSRVVDWVQLYKENKKIDLVINVETCNINTFAGALTQTLSNIILNAISHGYRDLEEGKIEIKGSRIGNERYELKVIDDGSGFLPEEITMATHAFYTSKRQEGFVGLGLTIARSIVYERLGGELYLSNNKEGGACISIKFPIFAPQPKS